MGKQEDRRAAVKAASESLQDRIDDVWNAFSAAFPAGAEAPMPQPLSDAWVCEVYDTYVIIRAGGKLYQANYTMSADEITFSAQSEWVEVEENEPDPPYVPVRKSVLKGVTKSEADGDHPASHYLVVEDPQEPSTWHLRVKDMQGEADHGLMGAAWAALHSGYRGNKYEGPGKSDALAKLKKMYAAEGMDTPAEKAVRVPRAVAASKGQSFYDSLIEDPAKVLVTFGEQVKALGGGRIGGHLVVFGGPDAKDLTGEYFTPETDFGSASESDILYQHGFDPELGRKRIGHGTLVKDEVGIWIDAQLNMRDEYERAIYGLAEQGKLGWSSGTAGHLVSKDASGKITEWPLGLDASLTPTPAEFRTQVVTLKSVVTSGMSMAQRGDQSSTLRGQKESVMDKEEIKAMLDTQKDELVTLVEEKVESKAAEAATKAVEAVLDKLPEVKAMLGGGIEVVKDEADRPFKSIGDNLIAIAMAAKGVQHPRLRALKALEMKAALGANEAVPSQGEFLLEPTVTAELLKPIHDVGIFSRSIRMLPVNPNSNSGYINGVDETSRATGSRWGGVQGYHAAEAASMTASKPKFRRINWELKKLYVLMYATDELLQDAGMLGAIIQQSASEELDFLVNDDILRGIGGDRAEGILQSGSLISIARAATSAVAHADIVSMWARLLPRSKPNAAWYINSEVHPQLDALTFTSGSTGILSPYVRYDENGVMRIYGRPVIETEHSSALGTAGDILLADMAQYLGWEKNAIEAASSIHVQFLTDETAFRFIYRFDGQAAYASAITPYKGSSTQSPFVTLLATT